jgi:hypothetical protein
LFALLAAVTTAAAFSLTSVEATPQAIRSNERYTVRQKKVRNGLVFYRIHDNKGPNQIRVVEMDPATDLTLDVELANDTIPGHERTSSMASRRNAVAAINGDYTLLPSDPFAGRPVHTFAEDARLVTSPLLFGRNFAIAQDESTTFVGHPKFRSTLTQADTGEAWRIDAWNDVPATNTFTVLTPEGGSTYRPPHDACSARLFPQGSVSWGEEQIGISQSFTVEALKCADSRMARRGGFILTARLGGENAFAMNQSLVPGETVHLSWSTGWPGIVDTVGGNPSLLENGTITAESCTGSSFCNRHPRTGIGVTAEGKILLVTVDGRQPGWSVGLRIPAFAKLMKRLGAVSALNLDGGGSTTMWLQGKVKNRVSDSWERPVGSSILVLPGRDPGEPVPLPFPGAFPTPTPVPTPGLHDLSGPLDLPAPERAPDGARGSCRSLRDPASTGGLLDMIDAGRHGRARSFAPALRRALEVFRDERTCRSLLGLPRR